MIILWGKSIHNDFFLKKKCYCLSFKNATVRKCLGEAMTTITRSLPQVNQTFHPEQHYFVLLIFTQTLREVIFTPCHHLDAKILMLSLNYSF